jgi:hypothetical protein
MADGSAPKRSQSWRGSPEVLADALAPFVNGPSWLKYGEDPGVPPRRRDAATLAREKLGRRFWKVGVSGQARAAGWMRALPGARQDMDKCSTGPERIVPHATLVQNLREVYAPLVFSQSSLVKAFNIVYRRKSFNFGIDEKVREDCRVTR